MKFLRTIFAAATFAVALHISASGPELIGRRGCTGGVENSVEAYREALNRGFKFIEGHVRVTADSVFVTSHDGKTARLGGNLKVEQSTIGQLRAEKYTQTREDSTTHTGGIATVEEFLDICHNGGATAVLHLKKFAKGTAPRQLDRLCALIDSVSSPNEIIILTSEPEYIEYLQASRPDMPLMFQADSKWEELLQWCLERKLNVSIKLDLITPECIEAFHDAGLKVAAWTVNSPTELPIDFAITDILRP